MRWYPLKPSTPIKTHTFGGRQIAERLGRTGLPPGPVAETWEISDVDGEQSVITNGPLAGRTFRDLVADHPDDLVGPGWRGERFPILTKFIDATGALPVHLHADDADARRLEHAPSGKTEAWHVLDAAPGTTALAGVEPGVDAATLRDALDREDFTLLRRLPVRPGETLYVPAGTLHSFGPGTLVYEIEQTSDVQRSAMRHRMEDGSRIDDAERRRNLDMLIAEWKPDPRPSFRPIDGTICCESPYFVLERHRAATTLALPTARIVTNVGAPVRVGAELLDRGRTLLLPAALREVEIEGPCDVLVGRLPS